MNNDIFGQSHGKIRRLDLSYTSELEEFPAAVEYAKNLEMIILTGAKAITKLNSAASSLENLKQIAFDAAAPVIQEMSMETILRVLGIDEHQLYVD